MQEMPTLAQASYASTTYNPATMQALQTSMPFWAGDNNVNQFFADARQVGAHRVSMQNLPNNLQQPKQQPKPKSPPLAPQETRMTTRIVQVFIADPDENIPIDSRIVYRGEQKLTDATDEELFFEVEIKSLLDKHNEKRTTFHNKKIKERKEMLEPARIRDLKMVVVNIASF